MPVAGENKLSALSKDPQVMIRVPIGAASPLWALFAGAAVSGAAWWWMTRWARPANLEAAFGAAEKAGAKVEGLAAPVVEAIEEAPAAFETAVEPAAEAVAEAPAAYEPVVEAAAETAEAAIAEAPPAPAAEAIIEDAPLAVGGEAAPISPVLEALAPDVVETEPAAEQTVQSVLEAAPAPKAAPRPKKTPPKAD